VEPGGRLVQDVERAPGCPARQLTGKLHPLRLAAGELRRGLTQLDVAEPDVVERLQLVPDRGYVLKEIERLGHRHVEDVGN
jgi:hypothetical protein